MMNKLEYLKKINRKSWIKNRIESINWMINDFIHKKTMDIINCSREETDKILGNRIFIRFHVQHLEVKIPINIKSTKEDIKVIWLMTGKWLSDHLVTHLLIYILGLDWISILENKIIIVKDNQAIYDDNPLWILYDLLLSYIAWIKLDNDSLNLDSLLNNKSVLTYFFNIIYNNNGIELTEEIFSIFSKRYKKVKKDGSRKIESELNKWNIWADILGVMELWFKKDFYISWWIVKEQYKNNWLYVLEVPLFLLPILESVFWQNKTIKVTKDNYEEIKQKFQETRVNYLKNLGVKNLSNQKEISKKILERANWEISEEKNHMYIWELLKVFK